MSDVQSWETPRVTVWRTITGPLAFCPECPSGMATYHGDGDRTAAKAVAWAKRHASETSHTVIVERGQSKTVGARA